MSKLVDVKALVRGLRKQATEAQRQTLATDRGREDFARFLLAEAGAGRIPSEQGEWGPRFDVAAVRAALDKRAETGIQYRPGAIL